MWIQQQSYSQLPRLQPRIATIIMIPVLILLHLTLTASQPSFMPSSFNVVGFFEPNEYNSSHISEDEDTSAMFVHAMDYANNENLPGDQLNSTMLTPRQYNITNQDGFLLAQKVCGDVLRNFKMGASLGVRTRSLREYIQIVSDAKQIPYFELMPTLDRSRNMVIQMHPDPHELVELLKHLIQEKGNEDWGWSNIFIVYESDEALKTYLKLLSLHQSEELKISSHHIESSADYTETFDYIKDVGSYQIIVDCGLSSIPKFLNKALEKQMLTRQYHYHFTSLDLHTLNLTHYSYGGAKITWSQLVQRMGEYPSNKSYGVQTFEHFLGGRGERNPPSHFFTTHNALLIDSMRLLRYAINDVRRVRGSSFYTQSLDCDKEADWWQSGLALRNAIHNQNISLGMTGWVQFTKHGQRTNYTMYIMQLLPGGKLNNIGTFKPATEFERSQITLFPIKEPPKKIDVDSYKHRVLNISTVLQEPYLMEKKNHGGLTLSGKEQYEGFVVDLMDRIAKQTIEDFGFELKYEFHQAADGNYGSPLDPELKEWNGMVGEVLRGEADMAVADLTINYEREQAIDFTKPFMTFGIAILYKVPEKEPPHMLSFMEPINIYVWGTIIVSVLLVSFSMYLFSRFSPTEWENPFPCQDNYEFLENQFNLPNAFWFSVGSIMQQGCDIMPKAPSTRIIAISWWLFTLIIISSYTANLAAFLTITTMSDTIKNADDLAKQTQIKYGCQGGGNTCSFFEKSKIATYSKMWDYMNSTEGVLTKTVAEGIEKVKEKTDDYAFLMESSSIQYQIVTDPECQLAQVGPPLNSLSYGIGVPDKSPLRDILSSVILRLNEKQTLLELYNKWWKVDDNKCKLMEGEGGDLQLKLKNLEGIFVFLMIGLAIASLVVCIEIIAFSVKRSKEEKVSACSLLFLWLRNSVKGTFPTSMSHNSLDRRSISIQGNHILQNNNKANIKNCIIEEETEPLNGHVDRVPESNTTDTLLHH